MGQPVGWQGSSHRREAAARAGPSLELSGGNLPPAANTPHGVTDVAAAVARVRARIAEAAARRGRRPEEVTLLAVTKGVDLGPIRDAVACGITDIGENRVQEAAPKVAALGPVARWHMVGHLQRNKVKTATSLFKVIQSLDSQRLAAEISRQVIAPIDVLVQVNVAGEAQKYGIPPEAVPPTVAAVTALSGIRVVGLMTIAPLTEDPETVRPIFRRLRELRDALAPVRSAHHPLRELSMGMSEDFEVAVEEGATLVRIGRAIFGERL